MASHGFDRVEQAPVEEEKALADDREDDVDYADVFPEDVCTIELIELNLILLSIYQPLLQLQVSIPHSMVAIDVVRVPAYTLVIESYHGVDLPFSNLLQNYLTYQFLWPFFYRTVLQILMINY